MFLEILVCLSSGYSSRVFSTSVRIQLIYCIIPAVLTQMQTTLQNFIEAIPLFVYVKIDTGKTIEHNNKLFIICYSRQLVSTQLWGHHQAMNKNWRNEMYMENYIG
jgi:hypothetical protein